MKAASQALIDYLANNDEHLFADLYTIILLDGTVLTFTSKDRSLVVDGATYRADQVGIDGLRYKLSVGLDTDSQTLTLSYGSADTINGMSWGKALRSGVFDGAYLRRHRAFYESLDQAPIGVVPLFNGRMSSPSPVGRIQATVKVKSLTLLLDTLMPKNTFQTGCLHGLFDAGCSLIKANYQMSWTVAAGPTNDTIPVPSFIPPLPAALAANTEGLDIFAQGTILFTSGVNEGEYRTIKTTDGENPSIILMYPLETPPAPGDTFNIWPGCPKTQAACTTRFDNLANFRGMPYTPAAETVL